MTTVPPAPPGVHPWEMQVIEELKRFMTATRENFQRGVNGTLQYLPEDNERNRAVQLGHWISGSIQIVIECAAAYAGLNAENEIKMISIMQKHFELLRKMQADHLAQAQAAEQKKPKLVGPSGLPVGEKAKLTDASGKPVN